jgi:NADPH:quinone reductase-like Zn-dependent oxidoreductase
MYRKIVVHRLSTDFNEATQIQVQSLKEVEDRMKDHEVLVQVHYAGVNASDVNFTAGRYVPNMALPCDVGFEVCL